MIRKLWFDGGAVASIAAVVILSAVPLWEHNVYSMHVLILILLYIILGLGLNVVVGFAGLLDLGYAAFYATGAYVYAILNTHWHVPFWPALPLGGLAAAVLGVFFGLPTLRARGDYLALVTLGLGEIVYLVLQNWDSVTNGPRGIMAIQGPAIPGFPAPTALHYYYIALALAVLTVIYVSKIRRSAVGRILAAIRDDETAARCLGIEPVRWKLYAFATGAFLAGTAGVFFAGWQHFVSPDSFTLLESVLVLSIVVLGGMGSIPGTIFATVFLVAIPEALRGFAQYRLLMFGLALIIVVIGQEARRRRSDRSGMRVLSGTVQEQPWIRHEDPHTNPAPRGIKDIQPILLRVQGLGKSFGGIRAVVDVSFELRKREIVALIGPNGAGKTSLFDSLTGVTTPDTGRLDMVTSSDSEETGSFISYRLARMGLARTFQDVRLFRSMNLVENLMVGAACGSHVSVFEPFFLGPHCTDRDEEKRAYVDHLMVLVGLHAVPGSVATLPLAVQRRVGLARALAIRPSVLLLDEPSAGLNEQEKETFCRLLLRIRDELGLSVLLIEHDMRNVVMRRVNVAEPTTGNEEPTYLVDRVLVMHEGRLIAEGTPGEIQANAEVREVYLGSEEYASV